MALEANRKPEAMGSEVSVFRFFGFRESFGVLRNGVAHYVPPYEVPARVRVSRVHAEAGCVLRIWHLLLCFRTSVT